MSEGEGGVLALKVAAILSRLPGGGPAAAVAGPAPAPAPAPGML